MSFLMVLWVIACVMLVISVIVLVYALASYKEDLAIVAFFIGIMAFFGVAILDLIERSSEDGARGEACVRACVSFAVIECSWIDGVLHNGHGLAVCATEDGDRLSAHVLDIERD